MDVLNRIVAERETVGAALDKQRARMQKAKAKLDAEVAALAGTLDGPRRDLADANAKVCDFRRLCVRVCGCN